MSEHPAEYSAYPAHSCGTCCHRAYGDARMISQCGLKVFGDPLKRAVPKTPGPRARDFGQKCKRHELSIAAYLEINKTDRVITTDNPKT